MYFDPHTVSISIRDNLKLSYYQIWPLRSGRQHRKQGSYLFVLFQDLFLECTFCSHYKNKK